MTAPHHGSANKAHLPIWTEKRDLGLRHIPVVSSGGSTIQRQEAVDYLEHADRACTRCRHPPARTTHWHETVRVLLNADGTDLSPICADVRDLAREPNEWWRVYTELILTLHYGR